MAATKRKKQPDAVKRALLDNAARLALAHGLSAVTVQAVAEAAGVSKGGFFHHFPNKQALAEAVVADLTGQFEQEIDALLAQEPMAPGRFTRAYIAASLGNLQNAPARHYAALHVAALAEPAAAHALGLRFNAMLARHAATDGDPYFEILRMAADGAWGAALRAPADAPGPDIPALRQRLIAMSRQHQA